MVQYVGIWAIFQSSCFQAEEMLIYPWRLRCHVAVGSMPATKAQDPQDVGHHHHLSLLSWNSNIQPALKYIQIHTKIDLWALTQRLAHVNMYKFHLQKLQPVKKSYFTHKRCNHETVGVCSCRSNYVWEKYCNVRESESIRNKDLESVFKGSGNLFSYSVSHYVESHQSF